MKLTRDFYSRDALTVSRELIGKLLYRRTAEGVTWGRIVEAEAYIGPEDKAAHSHKATPRTAIQLGDGGYAYMFLIYGMYWCLNVVANVPGKPECVLIRALEPLGGLELMTARRRGGKKKNLCSGPGKLTMAMDIGGECYGKNLCGDELWLESDGFSGFELGVSPRINIDYAGEYVDKPWRFFIKGSPYLSVK